MPSVQRRRVCLRVFGQGLSSAESGEGFVWAPTFLHPFQLRQIQPFTGCSCTKHVPFRYRFDEKQPVFVAAALIWFSLARIVKLAAAQ